MSAFGPDARTHLVQGVGLVIVLLRQTAARVGADERAARVCVADQVDVGGGGGVRRGCGKDNACVTKPPP